MIDAFEQCGLAMFGYITELDTVDITDCYEIETDGAEDMDGLLYRFLNELLYLFCAEPYLICKSLKITTFENYKIKCLCFGEPFSLEKHPQGADVKAITYSAMSIIENDDDKLPDGDKNKKFETYVILDI